MELFLKSPPIQEPLTIDEVRTYLKISIKQEDEFLLSLIKSARAHVESVTGRALLKQQWQMDLLFPSHYLLIFLLKLLYTFHALLLLNELILIQ